MSCGGYTCSRISLAFINIFYIFVALLLIGVAAYGKAVAIITTLPLLGGIIACGVFLLLIAIAGLVGAIKHHQVFLFFYMIILVPLFLIQFSVACACLALSDAQQLVILRSGWESASNELKNRTQSYFQCCGYDSMTQNNITDEGEKGLGHPACYNVVRACGNSEAICCSGNNTSSDNSTISVSPKSGSNACPRSCKSEIETKMHDVVKLVGAIGLLFAFSELFAVWLTVRYRNFKDLRTSPHAFL